MWEVAMKEYYGISTRPWVNQGYEEAEAMRKQNAYWVEKLSEERQRNGMKENLCGLGKGPW